MHTRLQRSITRLYLLLLTCFVSVLESRSPRTFSPQTVTQMTQEKFLAPIDKRLLARKAEAAAAELKVSEAQKADEVKIDNIDISKLSWKQKRKYKKKQAVVSVPKPKKKLLSEMTFDEVIVAKDRVMNSKNYTSGLKYIERALRLADNIDETEKLILEYADTLYLCQRYEKASRSYNELANLYPGSEKVEYALYQAIVCSSKLILDAERDQAKTIETIDLANQFLQRADIFVEYKERVEAIKRDAMYMLAQSEFSICNFYINSFEYGQAQRRLDGIRRDWLSKLPDIEPEILLLECSLAEKQNKPELITEKKKELYDKFPQATIELVQNKQRSNFFSWF